MAGRKAAVSPNEIFAVLKNLNIFSVSGELLVGRNCVWNRACQLLKNFISTHNLYIFVQ